MSWALRFLGVGSAQASPVLGSASGVLEHDGAPVLLIDCGQELGAEAVFTHFEHRFKALGFGFEGADLRFRNRIHSRL